MRHGSQASLFGADSKPYATKLLIDMNLIPSKKILATAFITITFVQIIILWPRFFGGTLPEGIISAEGRLEAKDTYVSAKNPGRISELHVDEGEYVTQGQLLGRIDSSPLIHAREQSLHEADSLKQTVRSYAASLTGFESDLKLAESEYLRAYKLNAHGFASQQLIDQALARKKIAQATLASSQAAKASAEASLSAAEAAVKKLTAEINDNDLISPIDGVVQSSISEKGEVVGSGSTLFILINPNYLFANIYLPTQHVGAIRIGDEALIVSELSPTLKHKAKVVLVESHAEFTPKEVESFDERKKLLFRVKVVLDEKDISRSLKAGIPATVYLRTSDQAWPERL
ncbi:efflux RND transporter periplasmic adaptor subunit [Pseudomonas aeruginosa]|nr:efflux RND transporter periplasmic adaptor subunit [Pseudomonas aeruginosa]MBV5906861.1 efflux RND transporter periplasmic adaptor subunit [Pseudomonas aeruginosa]